MPFLIEYKMIVFIVAYVTFLASALALDKQVGAKLVQSESSYLPALMSSFTSVVTMMNHGSRGRNFMAVTLVFFFVLALNFVVLVAFDDNTTAIITTLIRNNPGNFFTLLFFCFIISVWSFHQSLFFIKLAGTVRNIFGVLYLFLSDLLLSTLIVIVGVSALTAGYSFFSTGEGRYQIEWYLLSDCTQPCSVKLTAHETSGIVVGSQFEGLEFPSIDHLEKALDEVGFIEDFTVEAYSRTQAVRDLSDASHPYDVRVKATLLDSSEDQIGLVARFGVILGFHLSEFTSYFSTNFAHYSYVPVSFQPIEFRSGLDREFWLFKLLNDRKVHELRQRVALLKPDDTDVAIERLTGFMSDFMSVESVGFEPLEALTKEAYPDTHQEILSYIKVFSLSASQTTGNDSLRLGRDMQALMNGQKSVLATDLQQHVSKNLNLAFYGTGGVYSHYVPFTSLFITTISFGSLFLVFLFARFMSAYIGAIQRRLGDEVQNMPFTTFAIVTLPVVLLGYLFF